jgi:hypothetical protein
MLPLSHEWKESSMTTLIETTPKMDLAIQDIEHVVEELRAYHAIYSPLFQRGDKNSKAPFAPPRRRRVAPPSPARRPRAARRDTMLGAKAPAGVDGRVEGFGVQRIGSNIFGELL